MTARGPLTVTFVTPAANALVQPGTSIVLSVTASEVGRSISGVKFSADGVVLGSATLLNGQYTYTWTGAKTGNHVVTATATDSAQATGSASEPLTVDSTPVVSVTAPTAGAVVTQGKTILLTAAASDSAGSIAGVEFFDGSTDLGAGVLSGGVYSLAWTGAAAGTHAITAVATDGVGGKKTSAPVSFRVDVPPVVTVTAPASGAVFLPNTPVPLAATASDPDGSVSRVEFFSDGVDLGPATLSAGVYAYTWASPAPGTHQITAVATDNDGSATTSAAVAFRVDGFPVVSVTTPAGGSVFLPASVISLAASASQSGGTIAGVEFYSDGKDLGPVRRPTASTPTPGPTPRSARTRSPPSPPTTSARK